MRAHHNPLAWAATMLLAVAYAHVILELAAAVVGVAVAVRLLVGPARSVLRRPGRLLPALNRTGHGPAGIQRSAVNATPRSVDDSPPQSVQVQVDPGRIEQSLARLEWAYDRLHHVPTVGQIRAMAWFDGKEPCSYLLDGRVNFVPEPTELSHQRKLGRYALCFTCHDPQGLMRELVVTSDGAGFDLLGDCRWTSLLDGC